MTGMEREKDHPPPHPRLLKGKEQSRTGCLLSELVGLQFERKINVIGAKSGKFLKGRNVLGEPDAIAHAEMERSEFRQRTAFNLTPAISCSFERPIVETNKSPVRRGPEINFQQIGAIVDRTPKSGQRILRAMNPVPPMRRNKKRAAAPRTRQNESSSHPDPCPIPPTADQSASSTRPALRRHR
jgi:hypothetical protein